ncbi:MAG: HAD family hydrolase [Candidatus Moraniibacteriota bacterium]
MKIFLDFDDLLFNTRAFSDGLQDIFEEFGISKELFRASYQEIRAEFPVGGWCYSCEMHIERLRKQLSFDEEGLRKELGIYVADTEKFLFSDVKGFLSSLKKSGYKIFILSFGDADFQSTKISGTGISQFIERNIITDKDKAKALQSEINDDGKNAWFFDDRIHFIESVKRVFPKIRTVCIQREEGRYHEGPNEFCDYIASDLKEAWGILKNL